MKLLLHQVRTGGSLCLRGTCNFELIVNCSPGLELRVSCICSQQTNKPAPSPDSISIENGSAVSYAFQLASTMHRLAWSQLE